MVLRYIKNATSGAAQPTGSVIPTGVSLSNDGSWGVYSGAVGFGFLAKGASNAYTLNSQVTVTGNTGESAISPDGTLAVICRSASPWLQTYLRTGTTWALSAGQPSGFTSTVNVARFSPDNQMVAAGSANISVWTLTANGAAFSILSGTTGPNLICHDLAWSRDNKNVFFCAGTVNGAAANFTGWAISTDRTTRTAITIDVAPNGIPWAVDSSGSNVIVGQQNAQTGQKSILVYKIVSGNLVYQSTAITSEDVVGGQIESVKFMAGGKYFFVTYSNSAKITAYESTDGGNTYAPSTGSFADATVSATPQSIGIARNDASKIIVASNGATPYLTYFDLQDYMTATLPKMQTVGLGGDELLSLVKTGTQPSGPPAGSQGLGWSSDGKYCVLVHGTSPFMNVYRRDGNALTLLTGITAPPSAARSVSWAKDNSKFIVSLGAAPSILQYVNNKDDTFTQSAITPAPTAAVLMAASISPDGNMIVVGQTATPFAEVYLWDKDLAAWGKVSLGTTLTTQVTNVRWSGNSRYLLLTGSSNIPLIFKRTVSTNTFTQITQPATIPPSGQAITSADFSQDSKKIVVGFAASPYFIVYDFDGTTATARPAAPAPVAATYSDAKFSPDGNYVAFAITATPFLSYYSLRKSTPAIRPNPVSLPGSTGNRLVWSPDSDLLAISATSAPRLSLYQIQQAAALVTLTPFKGTGSINLHRNAIGVFGFPVAKTSGTLLLPVTGRATATFKAMTANGSVGLFAKVYPEQIPWKPTSVIAAYTQSKMAEEAPTNEYLYGDETFPGFKTNFVVHQVIYANPVTNPFSFPGMQIDGHLGKIEINPDNNPLSFVPFQSNGAIDVKGYSLNAEAVFSAFSPAVILKSSMSVGVGDPFKFPGFQTSGTIEWMTADASPTMPAFGSDGLAKVVIGVNSNSLFPQFGVAGDVLWNEVHADAVNFPIFGLSVDSELNVPLGILSNGKFPAMGTDILGSIFQKSTGLWSFMGLQTTGHIGATNHVDLLANFKAFTAAGHGGQKVIINPNGNEPPLTFPVFKTQAEFKNTYAMNGNITLKIYNAGNAAVLSAHKTFSVVEETV